MTSIDEIVARETPPFARAVKAIIAGDAGALRAQLRVDPGLVHSRSVSHHRATLLHYVSANGIESELQLAVPNADEIASVLIAAGADVDAPCDAYEGRCRTTMNLLVSSDHPTDAGVAGRLVELLCSAGAAVDGPDDDGSPLGTALYFATLDCVSALIARGARQNNPIFAAAAGNAAWMQSWLDGDEGIAMRPAPEFFPLSPDRGVAAEQALVFASMCGQANVVRLLLDRGVDINADPPGSHWTATPLHTAAVQGQTVVVDLLLRRGADPKLKDTRYQSTPFGWLPHARGPRRALAREVAVLLDGHTRTQTSGSV